MVLNLSNAPLKNHCVLNSNVNENLKISLTPELCMIIDDFSLLSEGIFDIFFL